MAWHSLPDRNGKRIWGFNPDGAARLIRSSIYNRQILARSRKIRVDLGFEYPVTTQVETNFEGIRAEVSKQATGAARNLDTWKDDPAELYATLVKFYADGLSAGDARVRMLREAGKDSAREIAQKENFWENALTAAKFVRDTSAATLFVGATILTGGAATTAAGVAMTTGTAGWVSGGLATGLTFASNVEDNFAAGQNFNAAVGNATVSTGITVVTNLLIPRGLNKLSAMSKGVTPLESYEEVPATFADNIAVGLITVHANIAGDFAKTVITAPDTTQKQFRAQLASRSSFEVAAMVFGAWLQKRGFPAQAVLTPEFSKSLTGGALNAVGDRVVAAAMAQGGDPKAADLDMVFAGLDKTFEAEAVVRATAMTPDPGAPPRPPLAPAPR